MISNACWNTVFRNREGSSVAADRCRQIVLLVMLVIVTSRTLGPNAFSSIRELFPWSLIESIEEPKLRAITLLNNCVPHTGGESRIHSGSAFYICHDTARRASWTFQERRNGKWAALCPCINKRMTLHGTVYICDLFPCVCRACRAC